MTKLGTRHSKKDKFNAVIAVISGNQTISEICEKYKVHQSAVFRWKKHFFECGVDIFDQVKKKSKGSEDLNQLQRKIGELTMDLDFLKNALEK